MFHVTISALDVSPSIFSMETFFGANLKRKMCVKYF